MASTFTPNQHEWRWCQDNAAKPTAFYEAENTTPTLTSDSTIVRLYVGISETGGANGNATDAWSLEWSTDQSNWFSLSGASHWNYANGQGTEGNSTTSPYILTTTTDVGIQLESGTYAWQLPKSDNVEQDFAIVPVSGNVTGTTYYFRTLIAGTPVPLGATHSYPSVTMSLGTQYDRAVAFTSTGTLAVVRERIAHRSVAASSTATLSVTYARIKARSVAFTTTATLAAVGKRTAHRSVAFATTATLATTYQKLVAVAVAFSAAATFAANGIKPVVFHIEDFAYKSPTSGGANLPTGYNTTQTHVYQKVRTGSTPVSIERVTFRKYGQAGSPTTHVYECRIYELNGTAVGALVATSEQRDYTYVSANTYIEFNFTGDQVVSLNADDEYLAVVFLASGTISTSNYFRWYRWYTVEADAPMEGPGGWDYFGCGALNTSVAISTTQTTYFLEIYFDVVAPPFLSFDASATMAADHHIQERTAAISVSASLSVPLYGTYFNKNSSYSFVGPQPNNQGMPLVFSDTASTFYGGIMLDVQADITFNQIAFNAWNTDGKDMYVKLWEMNGTTYDLVTQISSTSIVPYAQVTNAVMLAANPHTGATASFPSDITITSSQRYYAITFSLEDTVGGNGGYWYSTWRYNTGTASKNPASINALNINYWTSAGVSYYNAWTTSNTGTPIVELIRRPAAPFSASASLTVNPVRIGTVTEYIDLEGTGYDGTSSPTTGVTTLDTSGLTLQVGGNTVGQYFGSWLCFPVALRTTEKSYISILEAKVYWYNQDRNFLGTQEMRWQAVDADNDSPTYTAGVDDPFTTTPTTAYVTENYPSGPDGDGWVYSSDLTTVLEEVIARTGWSSGNHITLRVYDPTPDNNDTTVFTSSDGSYDPQLFLRYWIRPNVALSSSATLSAAYSKTSNRSAAISSTATISAVYTVTRAEAVAFSSNATVAAVGSKVQFRSVAFSSTATFDAVGEKQAFVYFDVDDYAYYTATGSNGNGIGIGSQWTIGERFTFGAGDKPFSIRAFEFRKFNMWGVTNGTEEWQGVLYTLDGSNNLLDLIAESDNTYNDTTIRAISNGQMVPFTFSNAPIYDTETNFMVGVRSNHSVQGSYVGATYEGPRTISGPHDWTSIGMSYYTQAGAPYLASTNVMIFTVDVRINPYIEYSATATLSVAPTLHASRVADITTTATMDVASTVTRSSSVAMTTTATMDVAYTKYSTYSRSVAMATTATLDASYTKFTLYSRSVAMETTATLDVAYTKSVARAADFTSTATLTVVPKKLVLRSVAFSTEITASVTYRHIKWRVTAMSTTATMAVVPNKIQSRDLSFVIAATVDLVPAYEQGYFTSSVAMESTGLITLWGYTKVSPRSVSFSSSATVTAYGRRPTVYSGMGWFMRHEKGRKIWL